MEIPKKFDPKTEWRAFSIDRKKRCEFCQHFGERIEDVFFMYHCRRLKDITNPLATCSYFRPYDQSRGNGTEEES